MICIYPWREFELRTELEVDNRRSKCKSLYSCKMSFNKVYTATHLRKYEPYGYESRPFELRK